MKTASDIFKSKWMKSVNNKNKKFIIKSFFNPKDKKEDFTEINLKLLELLKESENNINKEKDKNNDKKNDKSKNKNDNSKNNDSNNENSKNEDFKNNKKGIDQETMELIMNKIQQFKMDKDSSEKDDENKPGNNPHDVYLTRSETKQIVLNEARRVNEEQIKEQKKIKKSPTKKIALDNYLKDHPNDIKKDDDDDEANESS